MRNNFGKLLRDIREELGIRLYDMANALEISSSFLSAIETNKKPVPLDFVKKITDKYSISKNQVSELEKYAKETINNISLKLNDVNPLKIDFAEMLARSFHSLDDEDVQKMLNIINNRNSDESK